MKSNQQRNKKLFHSSSTCRPLFLLLIIPLVATRLLIRSWSVRLAVMAILIPLSAVAEDELPIADAHVHYSHDSVEMTPPERAIELMREAGLKFALVSSSDDNGTQLLSALAPDLIVPGLRPYRRRGELSTWFTDPAALSYVEDLLAKNHYATIGEFHLYGADVELEIPQRIVALAAEHNLILHAHSDAEAVERLLASNDTVKVLWAHSGFDSPSEISSMLDKHERLWADLAFRSEVGSGGTLSDEWRQLFLDHPDRLMLGTDTYTPERLYFLPEHASSARVWLKSLPQDIAENVAWKNAYGLLMSTWQRNNPLSPANTGSTESTDTSGVKSDKPNRSRSPGCAEESDESDFQLLGDQYDVLLSPQEDLAVSESFSMVITVCGGQQMATGISIDAVMPAHGHGMNYTPELRPLGQVGSTGKDTGFVAQGMILHMPGQWQWQIEIQSDTGKEKLTQEFVLK